ncbi:hypothetical protein CDD83_4148 [Cordyceps sp. RAO-2017]|nr:hypothetical protein CDD83_4148 [Cordyceps sp. RAO-2017]
MTRSRGSHRRDGRLGHVPSFGPPLLFIPPYPVGWNSSDFRGRTVQKLTKTLQGALIIGLSPGLPLFIFLLPDSTRRFCGRREARVPRSLASTSFLDGI